MQTKIKFPKRPAKKSSSTTPTPFPKFCDLYIGPIFVISKNLNKIKASPIAIKVSFIPTGFIRNKVVKNPNTSSITTACGSSFLKISFSQVSAT